MTASRSADRQLCVESDGSKKMEADIPVSYTESLFSKPPQSGMAGGLNWSMQHFNL